MIWACLALVAFLAVLTIRVKVRLSAVTTDFDREEWLSPVAAAGLTGLRREMLDDITSQVVKLGMTRDEVYAHLGPPDLPLKGDYEEACLPEAVERYLVAVALEPCIGRGIEVFELSYSSAGDLIGFEHCFRDTRAQ